ncbi:hypothetical protein HYPSUDRAFT_132979 [Hypholoma sublateritium FD-334 SS-4]|uniref:Aerobactin siderophore biosynthesis IucA/IucC N-terminal domain-containing protein n=1 Tax=Hypholoma sublateritium (strain FD-334 SS-4) TaxID=945553 RepID=A0A0D2P5T0_HYPSF|nr:hypothetical protein HYPSUDRAFT_132979 [Hypholoma sublateritium FD-334 SS-4]
MTTPTCPRDLKNHERAQFATASRLLSCLVTESLARALYQPLKDMLKVNGYAIILQGDVPTEVSLLHAESILAIVPLHHPPIFKADGVDFLGKEIGLLDPLDMIPTIFEYGGAKSTSDGNSSDTTNLVSAIINSLKGSMNLTLDKRSLYVSTDAISIWNKFAVGHKLDEAVQADIAEELTSAIKWQEYSYDYPPTAPSFEDPSIVWEQSIVEGHPTHPMHKTRRFLPPLPNYSPGEYDLLRPQLRFISIPRDNVKISNNFEELVQPLLTTVSSRSGVQLLIKEDHVVIPVHAIQVVHIQDKFPEAHIYPEIFSLPLLAQQSLRSVIVPDVYRGLHLKLAIGIKLTSAVRTISPESAYLGPRFSSQVVDALTMDSDIVTVARELASVVHNNPNGEIAKHCAALVRECHEATSEDRSERLIVCTSLVESGHAGKDGHLPSVVRAFHLNTQEKRLQWLERFVSIFLRAFLPPMLHNGVAFECHPQNCVARFDIETKELKGFIVRDFGGLKVHRPTLKASTGVDMDFIEGHSIIASSLDDVYTRMYHTIIHNHFQQLIRVLDLHYNGLGWGIVRQQLRANIPREHPLYDAWLSPSRTSLPGKCFLRMRMSSMYRFHLHGPFPNLIHYTGVSSGCEGRGLKDHEERNLECKE